MNNNNEIIFLFDIVCPYAYIASHKIKEIALKTNSKLIWKPVLLGGLYQLSNAMQGKDGSATSIMNMNKKQYTASDLLMQAKRKNVQINYHPNHPVRSLYAQRALIACDDYYVEELAHKLYQSYWIKNENINEKHIIEQYFCEKYNISSDWYENDDIKKELRNSTQFAFDHGAFGVPSCLIRSNNDSPYQLIWGQDRLHFIEWILCGKRSMLKQMDSHLREFMKMKKYKPIIKFFFDFSSPWCFLAYTQLHRLEQCANVQLIPVLLGAIFKSVGTNNVPMNNIPNTKRLYLGQDMQRWCSYWNEKLIFPDAFPLRTVLPLRMFIALNYDRKILDIFYRSAWQKNINIGDENEVRKLLLENNYLEVDKIINSSKQINIKQKLRECTQLALDNQVFGVPTFIVEGNKNILIWGQDRLDYIIEEICCNESKLKNININKL